MGPQCDGDGGDSAFFEKTNQMVAARRMESRFRFLASTTDRKELQVCIDEHDVFCLPSLSGETLSIAALEAMARGKPLMTSDYGPMPELVSHGVNGVIVPAGNQGAWTEAITLIASIRESLPVMGRQSFEKVRLEFSAEAIANEYLSDFRTLMRRRHSERVRWQG